MVLFNMVLQLSAASCLGILIIIVIHRQKIGDAMEQFYVHQKLFSLSFTGAGNDHNLRFCLNIREYFYSYNRDNLGNPVVVNFLYPNSRKNMFLYSLLTYYPSTY